MVIAPEDFRDEELFEPMAELEKAGNKVTVASTKTGQIKGSHGRTAESEVLISKVLTTNYDSVVFVGGSGAAVLQDNIDAHRIASEMNAKQKLVGAICFAPTIIAKAGLLKGKKFTCTNDQVEVIQSTGANYQGHGVVEDGNIVTADGPQSATAFGQKLAQRLAQ